MFSKSVLFLTILSLGMCYACSPSKEFPNKYPGDQIHFGQGGGFSGFLNYFVLLEDGRVYQRAFRDSTFNQVDTWPDNFTTQMFANYKSLHLDTVAHYEPGDQYYFIQYKSKNKPTQRIAWGKPGFRANDTIVTYYNLLYKSTKSKS